MRAITGGGKLPLGLRQARFWLAGVVRVFSSHSPRLAGNIGSCSLYYHIVLLHYTIVMPECNVYIINVFFGLVGYVV